LDFAVLGSVTRNRGKVMGLETSRDRRVDDVCLTPDQSESELLYNPTVSQSVNLGVEANLGLLSRDIFFLKFLSCHLGDGLSDERSGLSFVSLQSVYSRQSVFT
jgi:hypothetical protein